MTTLFDLSKTILGKDRGFAKTTVGSRSQSSSVRHGTAQEASVNGRVTVLMDGSEEVVTLITEVPVAKRQRVSVASDGGVYKVVSVGQIVEQIEAAGERIEAVEKAATESDAQLALVREDVEDAREAASAAQRAAEDAQGAAESAGESAAAASKAASDADAKAQKAIEDAAAASKEANELEAEIGNVREDAAAIRTEMAEQIEAVTTTMEQSYAKKDDVSEVETTLRSEITESVAGITRTFEQDYAKKTDLTSVEASLQTQISQTAGEITSVASSVQKAQADATSAQTKADAAASAASAAQTSADAAASNASAAQKAASDAQDAADAARSNLATAEAELASVKGRVGATEEDIAAAQKAVDDARAAAEAADSAAAAAQAKADKAEEDAAAAQTAADKAQAAAEAAQKDVDELAPRVTLAETKITQNSEAIELRATKEEFNALGARVGAAETKITQQADSITAQAKDIDSLGGRMSTVEQNASGIFVRLETVEGDVETAQSTASGAATAASNAQTAASNAASAASKAQGTADAASTAAGNAKTAADNAQSTANTAKSNAATAQSTADTAKANAATAQTTANNAASAASTAQSTANTARTEASNAAKTATNYLSFTSDGLVVGDHTGTALNGNVLIDSDSVDIRKGTSVLATFAAKLIDLGVNATNSVIRMCGGKGKIKAKDVLGTGVHYDINITGESGAYLTAEDADENTVSYIGAQPANAAGGSNPAQVVAGGEALQWNGRRVAVFPASGEPDLGTNDSRWKRLFTKAAYFSESDDSYAPSHKFGIAQWRDKLEFTRRNLGDNEANKVAFTIDGDGKVNFDERPTHDGVQLATINEVTGGEVDLSGYMPKSGGTFTGVVMQKVTGNPYYGLNDGTTNWYLQAVQGEGKVGLGPTWTNATKWDASGNMTVAADLTAGRYVTGSWLRATALSNLGGASSKVAVFRDDGWLYYRTPAELRSDIGAVGYTSKGSQSVAGTAKTVYAYTPPSDDGNTGASSGAAFFPEGIIMGGSAASAGLVTRGVCGIGAPDANGYCEKENLYVNYDGDDTYKDGRHLILQAGRTGDHYGSNLWQYAAARGDAVKGWVESQGFLKSSHTHNAIDFQDTRAVNQTPSQIPKGLSVHLKENGIDGISDGGGYHPSLAIRPWNDISGGPYAQIVPTQNGNLYWRVSTSNNDASWNGWQRAVKASELSGYAAASHTHSDYASKSTANTYNGEQVFLNSQYCASMTDTASGVGCAFKASRGMTNELLTDKLIMTASTGKLPVYGYSGTSSGQMSSMVEKASFTSAGGLKVNGGRVTGSGDDEGIVIGKASNGYAGLCLGDQAGVRSVHYLLPDNSAVWRWNNGSANYDIAHPGKAGTVALTSDIPSITYGTTDITPGSSSLAPGALYVVYE